MCWSGSFVSRFGMFPGADRAARDDRVQAVELLVRVEVDDQASTAPGPDDPDLGGEHAAQLGLEVLEVVAEAAPLASGLLLALATDQLLGLPHGHPSLQHNRKDGPL